MLFADYLTPQATSARDAAGSVVLEAIAAGTTVAVFSGRIAATAEVDSLSPDAQARALQIDDDLYLSLIHI